MTNRRIGDRPNFPLSNQRFDKGDAENISRYYERLIGLYSGSTYGQVWGCVSVPEFAVVPIALGGGSSIQYQLRFGRAALMYSTPVDDLLNTTTQDRGPWYNSIVVYDPDKQGQPIQSLILDAFAAAQNRPWVLFRRRETSTARGNKAYWDTSANTEEIAAADLQRTEWVEFRLSTSYQTADRTAGWYRMAYIDGWVGSGAAASPRILPIHWMDSQYYADSTPPVTGTLVASALALANYPGTIGENGFNPDSEMPTLAKLLHWMAGKLGQHYSTASTTQVTTANSAQYNLKPGAFVGNYLAGAGGWLSTPPRGLVEVDEYLNDLENDIIPSIQGRLNFLEQLWDIYRRTPRLLHTLYITPIRAGLGDWHLYTFQVAALTTTTAGPITNLNSYSPTLVPYTGQQLAAGELGHHVSVPTTPGAPYRLILEFVAGSSFLVTSADASLRADDFITQWPSRPAPAYDAKYDTTSPAVRPPSSYVRSVLEFSSDTDYDILFRRVIVVNIYGRNV